MGHEENNAKLQLDEELVISLLKTLEASVQVGVLLGGPGLYRAAAVMGAGAPWKRTERKETGKTVVKQLEQGALDLQIRV